MSAKLDRLGADREKARQKRDEWDSRFKELDRRYKEQENTEIHDMVHAANLTPEQLGALIRRAMSAAPEGSIPANITTEDKEDNAYED